MATTIDPAILAALKGLASSPENANDPNGYAQLSADRNARAIEMQRNLEKAQGDPNFSSGAVPSDVTNITGQTDPFTGALPQADEQQLAVANDPRVKAQADLAFRQKLGLAEAPNAATAAGNVAVEQTKANSALALQKEKEDALQRIINPSGQATPGNSSGLNMSGINAQGEPTFKMTVDPQTVQAQIHSAKNGLAMMGDTEKMVNDFANRGMIGAAAGPIQQALIKTGADQYLTDQSKPGFNDLVGQLKLTIGNLAYAHGAARGGSSPAMNQMFAQWINPNQSAHSLLSGLGAAKRWLTQYANAKTPEDVQNVHDQMESSVGGAPAAPALDLGQ